MISIMSLPLRSHRANPGRFLAEAVEALSLARALPFDLARADGWRQRFQRQVGRAALAFERYLAMADAAAASAGAPLAPGMQARQRRLAMEEFSALLARATVPAPDPVEQAIDCLEATVALRERLVRLEDAG